MNDLASYNLKISDSYIGSKKIGDIYYNCSNNYNKCKLRENRVLLIRYKNKIYCLDNGLGICVNAYKANKEAKINSIHYCCIDLDSNILTIYCDSLSALMDKNLMRKVSTHKEWFNVNPVGYTVSEIVDSAELQVI